VIKNLLAIFLVLHGLIHLIGFVVPWKIIQTSEFPYTTTVLARKVALGAIGVRLVGLLWLLAAVLYVIAGYGLWTLAPWWQGYTLGVTAFSLVLCVIGWPEAQFGFYIDVVLLALLLFGGRIGIGFLQ
jgi:hypothetical protein